MKKYLLFLLFLPQLVLSQQVKVLYSRTINSVNSPYLKNLPPSAIAQLSKKSYDVLWKNKEASLFFPKKNTQTFVQSDTIEVSPIKREIRILTVKKNNENIVYVNPAENYYIEKVKIRNKEYFVKDKLPELKWKILPEKKKILGHPVQKATALYNGTNITAWFAKDISLNAGPRIFQGLPGLIMDLEMDKLHYKAEKVDFVKNLPPIEPPKHQGKYLTANQYRQKMMNLQKELGIK